MNIVFLALPSADRADIVGLLNDASHLAIIVETAAQATARASQVGIDLVLLDLASGVEALRFLRRRGQRVPLPVVGVADRRQPAVSSEALRLGVADIIGRPVRADDLMAGLANAREFGRLTERALPDMEMPEPADGVFGASPAMRDVLGIVRRVAQSRCGVLIVGERGTGRETIARAIHLHGPRRDHPFVKFRCGEIDPAAFAAVLERGTREDVTIFLEDLGDMPANLQAGLEAHMARPAISLGSVRNSSGVRLSVSAPVVGSGATAGPGRSAEREGRQPDVDPGSVLLQSDGRDPEVRQRSGTTDPLTTLRVIAAAQPRITDWVEGGIVRRGLVEMISVVRVDLPPLRQRREDVPLLATYFLKESCRRNHVEPKAFSRSALTLLSSLPWPGNASELRSLAERLTVLVPGGIVLLEDVLANVRFDGAEAIGRARGSLKNARERFERDYVTAVLQHHKGRMGAAAKELGIERTNLYRKIKQLKIQWTVPD